MKAIKQIRDWMYSVRCTPCDMDEEFKILGENKMNELCIKKQFDCRDCIDEYLESEAVKE